MSEKIFRFLNMDYSKLSKKTILLVSYTILLMVLIFWFNFKGVDNIIINSESTLNNFESVKLIGEDSLTFGSKYYGFGLENLFNSYISKYIDNYLILIIYFLIFGLTLFILYDFLIKNYVSKDIIFLFFTFFSISPIVLYNLFSLNESIISFFLFSLILYLDNLYRNTNSIWYLILYFLLLIFILPFLTLFNSLIFYLFYLCYLFSLRDQKKLFYIFYILSIVIFLYVLSEYIVFFGLANLFVFHNISFFEFLQSLISDFGAKFGVNIFFFILSFVGIYKLWIIKYKLRFMYVFFVFLILFHIFFNPFNNFYSSLFICLFGAVGYIIFKNRHWSNLNIKSFTLLLLFCGLLFSTISFYVRLPSFDINEDQIAFLKGIDEIEYINIEDGNIKNSFLNKKDGIFSDATILSHPKYSNFIKFYNGKVLADLNDIRIKSIDSADDQIDLLMTQNINFALKLIKKYDIDFVLVSKDMENGDLWYYRTDGLQLFFNEKFRGEKLFDLVWFNADYKLYRVEKLFFLE